MQREKIDLCGLWRFAPDVGDVGQREGFFDAARDVRLWREVRVPCSFDDCGLTAYEGVGWFRRTIFVPQSWAARRVVVRFEGVNYHPAVWVNGQLVGGQDYGFLPLELPVGSVLQPGRENVIAVRADSTRRDGEVPGMQRGWRPFGGILREASLIATDRLFIESTKVVAEPAGQDGDVRLTVTLRNEQDKAANASVIAELTDAAGAVVAHLSAGPVAIDSGASRNVELRATVAGAKPWSPESPALYTARCVIKADGRNSAGNDGQTDEAAVRFGFRRVEVKDGQILLNGKTIFLAGFNRHEDSPRTGMCPDLATVRDDLLRMKGLGCNFIRLCHYPHHTGELDLCDQLGLLVMGEIPLYWWGKTSETEAVAPKTLAAAHRQLAAMIDRDYNHPSIIFWSVSNETYEERPYVVDGNHELTTRAKQLDPTRLAVHVSHVFRAFAADDVICINGYPSTSLAMGWELPGGPGKWWSGVIERLRRDWPNKPIFITEFGHPCLAGVRDNPMGEEVQARAIETEFVDIRRAGACGALIWCWADHPWPEEYFIRYLTTSPYGIVSRDRRDKLAVATVKRMFAGPATKAQASPHPQRGRAGFQVCMIRPNLQDIPDCPLPPGYSMRPMEMADAALWADVWRDAEPFFDIADDAFIREFGQDPAAVRWRCFLLLDERRLAVGTISSWYNRDFRDQDYGQIHWVAIRRSAQGKKLGKGMMTYALRQMAQWHDRALLYTQTDRVGAIKVYLDFGFRPDLESPGAISAWQEVKNNLSHPGLASVP